MIGPGDKVKLIKGTDSPYCAWDAECVEKLTAEEFISAYPKFAPKARPPRAVKASQKARRSAVEGAAIVAEVSFQAGDITSRRWKGIPLTGPTHLARILIGEGEPNDKVLAATKFMFGGRTDGPHLFTKSDLVRLRARLERKT